MGFGSERTCMMRMQCGLGRVMVVEEHPSVQLQEEVAHQ